MIFSHKFESFNTTLTSSKSTKGSQEFDGLIMSLIVCTRTWWLVLTSLSWTMITKWDSKVLIPKHIHIRPFLRYKYFKMVISTIHSITSWHTCYLVRNHRNVDIKSIHCNSYWFLKHMLQRSELNIHGNTCN